MKELKDILSHYSAEPSDMCWEKLSQRLDVAMPTQEVSNQATQQASSSATAKTAVMSTGAKVITSLVSAAILATATTFTVISINKKKEATATVKPSVTQELSSSSTSSEKSIETTITVSSDNLTSTTQVSVPETVSNNKTVLERTNDVQVENRVALSVEDQKMMTSTPKPNLSWSTQITTATPKVNVATEMPTPTRKAKEKITNIQDDPVLMGNTSVEEIDWSQPIRLEIPNVFTPNGDGYNDFFVINGIEQCDKRLLIIRNRSGKIVYRSNSYENNWDGSDCPAGTYTYQFFYRNQGIEQSLSGNVTIIRNSH